MSNRLDARSMRQILAMPDGPTPSPRSPASSRTLRAALTLAAQFLISSCGGAGTGDTTGDAVTLPNRSVTAVAVAPQSMSLTAGESGSLTATLSTSGSPPVGGWTTTWQSSSPSVAIVSAAGVVSAIAAGTATITATAGGKASSAVVSVEAAAPPSPIIETLALSPSSIAIIAVGNIRIVNAIVNSGAPAPAGGWNITWSSGNPAIATVSPSGVVLGVAPGTTTVSASLGGKTASLSIEVLPQPGIIDFGINFRDDFSLQQGDKTTLSPVISLAGPVPYPGLILTWTSSNPAVATVAASGQDAIVTAVALGTTTITLSGYGKTASVGITVVAKPAPPPTGTVSAISIRPSPLVTWPELKHDVQAVVTASTPEPTLGWPIVWTSSNPSVAIVDAGSQSGAMITGITPGTSTLTASLSGITATTTIYIAEVTSLTLSPATLPDLAVGAQATITATTTVNGPLPWPTWPAAWTSSSPLVATISPSGVVNALGVGRTKLWAAAATKSQSLIVTVTGPPPQFVFTGPDTVKGTIAQTAQGFTLSCAVTTSLTSNGPGMARWTKTLVSFAGAPFQEIGGNAVQAAETSPGQSANVNLGIMSSAPVATSASVVPWTVGLQFHYAPNADPIDAYSGGVALDYFVQRNIVCAP